MKGMMMHTTSTPAANGRQRKTLAHQLDRLDAVLDGLSDGLNEAISDAVRAAVGPAVQAAVTAALQDRSSRTTAATPPAAPPPASRPARSVLAVSLAGLAWLWHRLMDGLRRLGTGARQACRQTLTLAGKAWGNLVRRISATGAAVRACGRAVLDMVSGPVRVCRTLGRLAYQARQTVAVAGTIGAAAGLACWWAGPLISAVACAWATALLAALGRLLRPAWQAWRTLAQG
jgi:hypothetical protein